MLAPTSTRRKKTELPDAGFLQKFFDLSRVPLAYEWRIDPGRRLYVNRNMRMDEISAVGFDMDYTVAIYKKRAIEELAFEITLQKLVEDWHYPEGVYEARYDSEAVIRGLVLDRKLGNFLKMDQYHAVSHAVHGKTALTAAERRALYHNRKIRLGQERYFSIDTLFGLPEGSLFQELVAYADRHPDVLAPDYWRIYDDIRAALDRAHRDNSLKSCILEDPGAFLELDPKLPATLEKFLKAGKKLFILTNSEWHYTDALMSFLLDGQIDYLPRWTDYFDVVGVEASKPGFFQGEQPLLPVEEAGDGRGTVRIFRKGSVPAFEELLGARSEQVLFVGDHIYGDILRSKKHSFWRTVMIVEELEQEIASGLSARPELDQIVRKQRKIERRDFERNLLHMKLALLDQVLEGPNGHRSLGEEIARQRLLLADMDHRVATLQEALATLEETVERRYNATWGPLFRAGSEISRFGEQVQNYACLYTSRVSNFLAYPFNKVFRSPRETMPHDL